MNFGWPTYRLPFRALRTIVPRTGLGFMLLFLGMIINHADGQIDIITPRDSAVSSLDRQVVTVRSLPGAIVELLVNNVEVRRDTVRIDGLLDFINVQVPMGDIVFTARLLGKEGSSGGSAERRMHILGPPASIVLELEKRKLFADGKSSTKGLVAVFDRWKYRISEDVLITVDVDSGVIKAADLDKEKRGNQLGLHGGVAQFEYVAGCNSGIATVRASVDSLQANLSLDLNTPYEKFTLVGLASGTAQSSTANTAGAALNSSRDYPDGLTTDGRAALYARGTILGDYRLVASYDNDRRNTSRFYRDLDPDYLYSIYGDNSMLTYDAQTTRQLYARLEHDKIYAMVGDFNTDLTKQEFTAYNRTLYGLKAGHQEESWRISGFGSVTDRKVVQLEIRGTGLSGLYNLGYLNVTTGSEKIRIETRDRFHSEVLLKQTDQYRFSDYEIDYAQGTIFFKQPIPAIDAQGNPVYIVASFEANDAQKKSYVAGGRVEHDLTANLTLGLNGVLEQQDPKDYSLLGGDMKMRLDNRSSVSGEIGRSDCFSGSGSAYKLESSLSPLSELSLNGYYRRVESSFLNPTQSGSGRELGTRKYGAGGSYQVMPGTKFSVDYYHSLQEALGGDVNIRSIAGAIDQSVTPGLSSTLRMEDMTYRGPGGDTSGSKTSTHSLLASALMNYAVSQRLTIALEHERNLGADRDITKPNGTIISGAYRIADPLSLQAAQKFFEDGSSLSSFGVTSAPMEGTTLYSKYEIGNAIGQHRNLLSIGLKNRVRLPLDLIGNVGLERAKSLETRLGETPTDDHVAYSASLEYLPDRPVKASVKAEYGEDNLARKSNYFAGVDFRLLQDVSAVVKWNVSLDDSRKNSGYENRSHLIVGAAYRPVETNVFNLVGKVELNEDDNHYLAPFNEDRATIASLHAFVEPVRRIELGCKLAYKYGTEKSVDVDFASHTFFYLLNGRYNLSQKFDVGGEYRLLRQREAQDWLIGYHAEVGYIMINNLRVAAGYNFKGYKEQDLVDYALWAKGPFVRMSYKFDESLFGL